MLGVGSTGLVTVCVSCPAPYLPHHIHTGVVLVRRALHFIQHNQLVTPRGSGDGLLALGHSPDHFVALDFRHLSRPLTRPAARAVDEAPLARLERRGGVWGG